MRVVQGVERVITGALCRADVGNHDRLTVTDERLAQHLRQFTLSIRRMISLLVDASYALLQLHAQLLQFFTAQPETFRNMSPHCRPPTAAQPQP